ncbi:MAG: hypothetical protein ACRD0G_07390 [Acidimicrobiales bacterium]
MPTTPLVPATEADLEAEFEQTQVPVQVFRVCRSDNGTGDTVFAGWLTWQPGVPMVNPRQLALMARSQLQLPLPEPRSAPPLDRGERAWLIAFPTWLWIDNWESATRSATAGAVTATVTATPSRQQWLINDVERDFDRDLHEVACRGPGTPYDSLVHEPGTESPDCGLIPQITSGDQPSRNVDGRPCFDIEVTVYWQITWTSNVGASGELGELPRTTTICARVVEIEAVIAQ